MYGLLPQHALVQSPCYPIIAIKQGHYAANYILNNKRASWSVKASYQSDYELEVINITKLTHD